MSTLGTNPLVSVVIPTIKFDEYTSLSIKSALNQSYTDIEVVLVLDGAPYSDLPSWITDHRQIKIVVHEARLGTPISLNDGVRASNGDLIARLDADDIAHPERIEYQVEYLRENPKVVCVGTSFLIIDEHGVPLKELSSSTLQGDIREKLLLKNQLLHSSVMYRRESFEAIGGYNPMMTRSQDYDLYLRLARVGPLALSDRILCAYRVHGGQHSRKTSPFTLYTLELLNQRHVLRRFLGNPALWQIVYDCMWYTARAGRYLGFRKPGYLQGHRQDLIQSENFKWLNPEIR